jgi:hypothetical protein
MKNGRRRVLSGMDGSFHAEYLLCAWNSNVINVGKPEVLEPRPESRAREEREFRAGATAMQIQAQFGAKRPQYSHAWFQDFLYVWIAFVHCAKPRFRNHCDAHIRARALQ